MASNTEVVPTTAEAYTAVTKGEIDMQIATAHQYPRDVERFVKDAIDLVKNPEIAKDCIFILPRGKKKITGPSVRLAEIVASNWRNLRIGTRILGADEKEITCQGVCHDLETNVCISQDVKRRITGTDGRKYNDDMITMTGNAGSSIALRNAVFRVVPKAIWNQIFEAAKSTLKQSSVPLPKRIEKAVAWFAGKGIAEPVMLEQIDKADRSQITEDDVVTLQAIRTAIEDGTMSVDKILGEAKHQEMETGVYEPKSHYGQPRDSESPAPEKSEPGDAETTALAEEIDAGKMIVANLRNQLATLKIDDKPFFSLKAASEMTLDELQLVIARMQAAVDDKKKKGKSAARSA